jgi:hypothetical protein
MRSSKALLLSIGVAAAALCLLQKPAYSLVCPTPLSPPCCPSPCPVTDPASIQHAIEALKNARKVSDALGTGSLIPGGFSRIDPATLENASLSTLEASIQATLRSSGTPRSPDPAYPDAITQIPEAVLPKDALPDVHANLDGTEGINDLRRRIHSAHVKPSRPSGVEEAAMLRKRRDELREIAINAYAAALVKRQSIARHQDRHERLLALFAQAETVSDEFRNNAAVKLALFSLQAEVSEMMSLMAEVRSAGEALRSMETFSASGPVNPTYVTPEDELRERGNGRLAMTRSSEFHNAVLRATTAHNELTSILRMQDQLRTLEGYVNEHEERKLHMYLMENTLYDIVSILYEDPDYAFGVLKSRLWQLDQTNYGDGDRYQHALDVVQSIYPDLAAQVPETVFGVRRQNPYCNRSGIRGEETCSPFTTVDSIPDTQGIQRINAFYANDEYDSYKVKTGIQRSPKEGGFEPYSPFVIAGQYYLEAGKRKAYWDDIRRGDGQTGPVTSLELWNELLDKEPGCFSGPMQATREHLERQSAYFDVSPSCAHRRWSSGPNAGEVINHAHLGGIDQSIWMIRNAIDYYNETHGGRPEVDALILEAERILYSPDLRAMLAELGMTDTLADVESDVALLAQVKADAGNEQYFEYQ